VRGKKLRVPCAGIGTATAIVGLFSVLAFCGLHECESGGLATFSHLAVLDLPD
jgi:hypothetical protein